MSLSSRSSLGPQGPAFQIEASLVSLSQELADQEASIEGIAKLLEALTENCSTIRVRISTLRRAASQIETNPLTGHPSYQRLTEPTAAEAGPATLLTDQIAAAARQQVELELLLRGRG